MELLEKFNQQMSLIETKDYKRLVLYFKNPSMATQNFKIRKSEINSLRTRMLRIGRDSYSWFEILEMDLPTFKKTVKLREVNDIKKYLKGSQNTLQPR